LERDCRPVRVEPGQIVFQPVEGGSELAPTELASRLSRALKSWTGQTWPVHADAAARGGETIAEIRAREAADARAQALADPLVAEAMSLWPGAEIAAIRPVRAAKGEGARGPDSLKEDGAS